MTQSWAILMYLCEKTGKFLPADPVARVRMFQWMAEGAADYAPTNQNIFFLGARMPEKVPDSAIVIEDPHRRPSRVRIHFLVHR